MADLGRSLAATASQSTSVAVGSNRVKPSCFISHPDAMRPVAEEIELALKPFYAVEADYRYTGSHPEALLLLIRAADLFVCILDGLRPNVVYELGFAVALGVPRVVMLRKNTRVDVKSLYPPRQREGIRNPPLNLRLHLGMFKPAPCWYTTGMGTRLGRPGAAVISALGKKWSPGLALYHASLRHQMTTGDAAILAAVKQIPLPS